MYGCIWHLIATLSFFFKYLFFSSAYFKCFLLFCCWSEQKQDKAQAASRLTILSKSILSHVLLYCAKVTALCQHDTQQLWQYYCWVSINTLQDTYNKRTRTHGNSVGLLTMTRRPSTKESREQLCSGGKGRRHLNPGREHRWVGCVCVCVGGSRQTEHVDKHKTKTLRKKAQIMKMLHSNQY